MKKGYPVIQGTGSRIRYTKPGLHQEQGPRRRHLSCRVRRLLLFRPHDVPLARRAEGQPGHTLGLYRSTLLVRGGVVYPGLCHTNSLLAPGRDAETLTGGFLFGSLWAALYVNIGATIGATLAFFAARYLFRDWVEQRFGNRLAPFQEGFRQNVFTYLLTDGSSRCTPHFLVNLLSSGLTRVKSGTYVAATALGIIPGSLAYIFASRQLSTINSLAELLKRTLHSAHLDSWNAYKQRVLRLCQLNITHYFGGRLSSFSPTASRLHRAGPTVPHARGVS